ncbi:MAG: carbohydrate-binding protein, partial [Bacteroidales bacterium]|nr:carbohydrate-binding protein [Bacteroidales bacterium]
TNGVLTVDLAAGSHALSKGDVANLYYMSLSNGGGTTTPPASGVTTITLQESQAGFCGVDGTVDNNNAGFTGAGFANTDNATGKGIDYAVNAEGGETSLLIQYANGASDRPAKIVVNGSTAVGALSLPSTGSWTSWTSASTIVTLQNGVNTIRLEATNSGGLPNIDFMSVSGAGVSASSCDPSDPSNPSSYTLTTTINGSGSVSPSQGTFNAGTSVVLTATPASGWEFTGWSGGYTGTSATVVMDANKNITANFSQVSMPGVDFSMKGYATVNAEGYSTTTGGAGGSTRTISSLSDLENWASSRENNTSPEVVYISGKIASSSSMIVTIKHGANISILGIGSTAELQNIGLNIRNYKNVIVRNLKIHEVLYPNDALTIDECNHVWVDHCELYSKIGSGIGVDTYDGLLDIKNGSRYVTISWCYLHDHMKCSLIGHTNNTNSQSTDSQMRITYHHNYFYNTDGRNPSLRYGAIHMYNNYFNKISDYGLAARVGAHALVENNHYNDVLLPLTTDKFPVSGLPNGYICQTGNLFTGSCGDNVISQTGCNWWNIPYNYTLDPASTLSSIVPANVGVGKISELKSATVTTGNESIQVQKNQLYQNYPNPFSDETTIGFNLQNSGRVSLAVFDMTGRKVVELFNGYLEAGEQSLKTDAVSALPSGAYVYRLEASDEVISKMMMKR